MSQSCPKFCPLLFLEVQGHLAKGQRMLAGDGMSQVTKNLLDLTQRRNFYAGDLLSSVEILRNVTETFKRASYEPSSDDVQVSQTRRNCSLCVPMAAEHHGRERHCISKTAPGLRPAAHGSGVSGDLLHVRFSSHHVGVGCSLDPLYVNRMMEIIS